MRRAFQQGISQFQVWVLGWLIIMVVAGPVLAGVTLVENGEPRAVLVLPPDPDPAEQQAADELVEHIRLMSGATLPVAEAGKAEPEGLRILMGRAADAALDEKIRVKGEDPWAFALAVRKDAIHVRGLSPEGTRSAAYEMLEQLGVRWYMPGEIGREVPQQNPVRLKVQETIQVPSFCYRKRSGERAESHKVWSDRMRLGGAGHRAGQHGIAPLIRRDLRASHPEFFAEIGGKRVGNQLCLTNPEVFTRVLEHHREQLRKNPQYGLVGRTDSPPIIHVGPNDGGGFCECERCRALDPEGLKIPLRPTQSYTDRYLWFYNRILDALAEEFPDVKIGFYVYGAMYQPPKNVKIDPKRYEITVYPIHACRIHGMINPVCPESNFASWLYEFWRPHVSVAWDGAYWFNLAGPGLPFSMVHRLRREIPALYALGVRHMAGDFGRAWPSQNPSMYVASRLMWNVETDVEAVLADFYAGFYGPAAEPMAAYHTLMDATVRDADHHTGSTWDFPEIYPDAVRTGAGKHLDAATRLAGPETRYATRVEITRKSFDLLEAYVRGRQHRNALNFVEERRYNEEAERIRDELGVARGAAGKYEFPMLAWHAGAYLNRFTTDYHSYRELSGYARVTGGNVMVAGLSPEWKFQLDPHGWGRYIGLHSPESVGGNWQLIRTDTSWSNQGLRYYFGQAWYRQTVFVPDGYKGRRIMIWFSGVDSTAEVWVNGTFVGANHGGAEFDLDAYGSSFRPFEFEVADVIKHGEANTVTVRIVRPSTNELGTGGIVGPVMFYVRGD